MGMISTPKYSPENSALFPLKIVTAFSEKWVLATTVSLEFRVLGGESARELSVLTLHLIQFQGLIIYELFVW